MRLCLHKTGTSPASKRLDFPLAFSLLAHLLEVGKIYSFSVSSVASASAVSANFLLFSLFNTVFLLG
jgi:hypothetical protein